MTTSPAPSHRRRTGGVAHPRTRRALAVGALLLPMLLAFGATPGVAAADEPASTGTPPVAPEPTEPAADSPAPVAPTPDATTPPPDDPAPEPVEPSPSAEPSAPAHETPVTPEPSGTPDAPADPAPTPAPVVETSTATRSDESPATPTAAPDRPAAAGTRRPGTYAAAPGSRLGTAGNFAILAGSTITNTARSVVTGDVGLHPGSAVTGFGSCTGAANCVDLTGTLHVTDGVARQAKADLLTAYDTLVGLEATCTPLVVELGGTTLTPGVYCSPTFGLTGTLTLSGVGEFVFLTGAGGSALTTASGSQVLLVDGADACGVYWQVASSAVLGEGSAFAGNILARTSISFGTAATLDGSALALDAAVTLIGNTITDSACAGDPTRPGNDDDPPPPGDDDDPTPPADDDPAPPADDDDETTTAGPLPGAGLPGGSGSGARTTGSGGGLGGPGLRTTGGLASTGSPIGLYLLVAALSLGVGALLVRLAPQPGRHRAAAG